MVQKKFEELSLNNAFLFAAALEDEETCRLILEMILGKPMPRVKVQIEHTLLYASEYKSIRLDVYATDEVQVGYNLEMQNKDEHNLPKRSRFHQAEIDVAALNPGDDFSDLKPSYIIFICTFDPFGRGLYRYTFEKMCLEAGFPLGDETCTVFLNTKGKHEESVPRELINFLRYVESGSDADVCAMQDNDIEKLHEKIRILKRSRRWRGTYMTLGEYIDDAVAEGIREGMKENLEQARREYLEKVRDELVKEARDEVERELRNEIEREARDEVERELRNEIEREIRDELEKEARDEVEKEIRSEVEKEIRSEVEKEIRSEVEKEARDEVEKKLRDEVEKEIRDELVKEARDNAQKESEERMLNLVMVMMEEGESNLIPKLKEEEAFLREMYAKYHIISDSF